MSENTNTVTCKCKWCGESLSLSHKGPCPKCGKKEKIFYKTLQGEITFKGSLEKEFRREFYKKNPIIKWLILVIAFGSPFLVLILKGWVEFIVGEALALLSCLLAPYVGSKVREITRYSS